MTDVELCLVGGGRMGEALLGGLVAAGTDPDSLAVVEVLAGRRAELVDRFPGVTVAAEVVPCRAGIVAVKPPDVAAATAQLAARGALRIVSIAAGITLGTLRAAAGPGPAVVRAMPNTPALVGTGATAIATEPADDADAALDWAEGVLRSVGEVVRLPETSLDAVTGLSGSGPAYVFLVAEALVDAGVLVGLSRPVAEQLAGQTLLGAARLLTGSDASAADLRAQVTSPGGTTAAGLRELERAGVRGALLDAVAAATARSRELGA
ncbi:MAG: pyrroline-5-carboxylate reductase [Actinomycetota bacterium]